MEFLGIEAFLAIVQTQSLTKAAEMLHLSQSTVSYRLKILERDVGAKLIDRKKGMPTIQLTTFGKSFVALAERWSMLNRELEILHARGSQINLNIGAADSLNIYVLPPLYQMIIQQCPAVRLQIRTQHTMESYESIERREMDLAFVKLEKAVPNMIIEPFYVDEMVLVRLASEENTCAKVISPLELDYRHELYFNWGPAYQVWHERWWDTYSYSRLQVDAAALIFSLMLDVRQWAIVPRSIANAFVKPRKFVVQQLSTPAPPRVCYKLMQKHQDPVKVRLLEEINHFIKLIYPEGKTFSIN
ncbi:DNA-binding transcriptional LysR family regulator [Sporomusaceae bacterium BoRhaA]|uniref:LysR family transcriptional regulator n=1 Tax=Pelorhabdus rhamnosifermentans TaxID=2772457 RepID=UPI001C063E7A|nr:LysR family transcriptional regulator [Pelorhabdus rhamnosifermentans]MBU2699945.1 DNA-binding transcriptional LysR family regulator [Pelorhabdus rhamnosifermentans]